MSRHLQVVADLIERGMSITARWMDDDKFDHLALQGVCVAGERFSAAIAGDGVVTLTEARQVYQALCVAQKAIEKSITNNEGGLEEGREISRGVERVAQMKGAAVVSSGPTNTSTRTL